MMVVWGAMLHVGRAGEIAAVFFFGIFSGGIPTLLFSVPGLLSREPTDIASAMAYVIVGENAGIIVGPPLFGALIPWVGFPGAFNVLAFSALAMIGCLVFTIRFLRPVPGAQAPPQKTSWS